jgi:hypothetical protein
MPTPSCAKTQAVAQRYGLKPAPESIARLTGLIAQQDANLEEIGKIIAKDAAMSARLLRFANPRATSEQDYDVDSVEEALMRTGLGPVILLAMIDPLKRAVLNAFEMFSSPLSLVPLAKLQPLSGEHIVATARFDGKGTGLVQLRLAPAEARSIAISALSLTPDTSVSAEEIDDVVGELANMIGGNLESNLCDGGIHCKLAAPEVTRAEDFHKHGAAGGFSERLGFAATGLTAFVDVSVNPWSD